MTKILQLAWPEDNADLGLAKGEAYYPVTHVKAVVGLSELVSSSPATDTTDGLMSSSDKQKLDNLNVEPVNSLQIVDKITGSIYVLTVENGEIKINEKGEI